MSVGASLRDIMDSLQTVLLLALGLSLAPVVPAFLWQFRGMIRCAIPDSRPIFDYADYGCYCGRLGRGTPLDDLDRCCQLHDQCYDDAMKLAACHPILDHPYIEFYHYKCDKTKKKITCRSKNKKCERFICECDRVAAECFARSPWNHEHKHYPKKRC